MKHMEIARLKKQLLEQLKTQGFADNNLCETLITLARNEKDRDSVAIGHLWLAESFLHDENKIGCSQQLEKARQLIDEQKITEILEKYYFIVYRLYTSLYDTKTAFEYCLKALSVSEQLYEDPSLIRESHSCFVNTIGNRVVGNCGNIGINFFNHGIYDKALFYCKKALSILESLDTVNVYAECLLRLNIIISLIRTNALQDVMYHIRRLMKLPIEKKSLKIYVDYAYVNYYLYQKDIHKIEFYVNELLQDQIEDYADRQTALDFYIDILSPVIELKMEQVALRLFDEVHKLIHEDEIHPLLNSVKLRIMYANIFNHKQEEALLYKQYYDLYLRSEQLTDALKINGLETRLQLNEIEIENNMAKAQIQALEDIANYDELTGVFNRRYLEQKYSDLLAAQVLRIHIAVVDIDYFKEYNDCYGHLAGDEILKQIANCLVENLVSDMMVCRYGGDEFVVLSWQKQLDAMDNYAQTILNTLNQMKIEHAMSPCAQQVSASIGYGSKPIRSQVDIYDLFDEADKALYIAKQKGRNQAFKVL